eukprot:4633270-Amphidinium_carterae.2
MNSHSSSCAEVGAPATRPMGPLSCAASAAAEARFTNAAASPFVNKSIMTIRRAIQGEWGNDEVAQKSMTMLIQQASARAKPSAETSNVLQLPAS